MRISKFLLLGLGITLALILSLPLSASASPQASSSETYTVMVGWENAHTGIGIMAYFPDNVTIHVGDTVHWLQNTNEIHTVTFLAGTDPAPLIIPAVLAGLPPTPSPIVFNPMAVNPAVPANGLYDGTTYANSGLMGREPGQAEEFSLTFTMEGTYDYMCLVHGFMMSGEVVVVGEEVGAPSPNQATAHGKQQIAEGLAKVPAVVMAANMQVEPPVMNGDGTLTHYVMIGYGEGQIDLMRFFPNRLIVRPGDTVVWEMSAHNDAPHTVTFLNGAEEPSLVIPIPQQNGPPVLYLNPAVLFPQQLGQDLTREGIYSSGVMNPIPGTTYTLMIGNMATGVEPYSCLLHDSSGMEATLTVLPG